MNKRDWQRIEEAANILQLTDRASLSEIKNAYHRLSKLYHPDTARQVTEATQEKMYQLTSAYEILMTYCREYRFPLRGEAQTDVYDPAEWWRSRFEENIFWGKSTTGKKKKR